MTKEKEIIESSIEEIVDDGAEEKAIEQEPQKKQKSGGGFLLFLTFLFSLAALCGTAYLYYLNYQKGDSDNSPITSLENQITQLQNNSSALIKDLKTLQKSQSQNTQALEAIKQKAAQQITQLEPSAPNLQPLIEQITSLKSKLDIQDNKINSLSSSLQSSASENQKNIQNLLSSQPNQNQAELPEIDFTYKRAESYLQLASISLEVQRNKQKALLDIEKAQNLIGSKNNPEAQNLSFQISQTIDLIKDTNNVEGDDLLKQAANLHQNIVSLNTNSQSKAQEKKEGSWFDNLIVVRKIDSSQDKKLSASESLVFNNQLNVHFDLLKLSVFSKDQKMWNDNLAEVDSLLAHAFPKSSQTQRETIKSLSNTKFKSEFPSLEGLISSLRSLEASQ